MEERKLEMLKCFVMNRIVPKCKLKEVCEKLNILIQLSTTKGNNETRTEYFGDKSLDEKYPIGLLDEHYFLIESTNISSFCLNHYEDVKEIPNCHTIVKKRGDATESANYCRENGRGIDSYDVMKILLHGNSTSAPIL